MTTLKFTFGKLCLVQLYNIINQNIIISRYHRRFIEVARKRYVDSLDHGTRDLLYLNLLDVFNEKWKDEPKPFKYNKLNKLKKNQIFESEARRYTSPNPIKFIRNGQEIYNTRKLNKVLELSLKINNIVLRSDLLIDKIFLNYDFIYGIFKRYFNAMDYTLTNNYIEELNYFIKDSKIDLSDYKIPISILIQLICMYNMNTLNDYPESVGLQLSSRLIGLYGISDFITKFIDECDSIAIKHCAMVSAFQCQPLNNIRTRVLHNFFRSIKSNQYLKTSDVTPDFFLCSKSIFIWVWAPEQGEKSKIIGEIILPDVENDFNLMKIYNPFETDKYEIIIANSKYVINIEDTGKEKWRLSLSNNDQIKNVSIIGDRGFIITYEERNYIDLYNLQKKTLIERKTFDSKIKFLKTNRSVKYAWAKKHYMTNLFIAIGLEDSTLFIYKVTCDYANSVETKIDFIEIYKRQFKNYILVSGLFELFKTASAKNNEKFEFRFIATFNSLKCILIDLEFDGTLHVKGLKALCSVDNKEADLSLISFKKSIVTMQYDKSLHLYSLINKHWYTLPGVYSYVTFNALDNYDIVCGIFKNVLNVFLIQKNENNYKVAHLIQGLQLSDEIFDAGIIESIFFFFSFFFFFNFVFFFH